MNIDEIDAASAAVARAPRITLDDIKAEIEVVIYTQADELLKQRQTLLKWVEPLKTCTICTILTKSGFIVIDKSVPVNIENYDAELGRKYAFENCIRQLWPLMAFHYKQVGLRNKEMDQPHRGHAPE